MPDLNFMEDYGGALFTGGGLHERLAQEGKSELVLTITAIRPETFPDTKYPEWILSFGQNEDELRLKKQAGRLLYAALGDKSSGWIGRQIALSVEWKEWEARDGKPMAGFAIKVRAIPNGVVAVTEQTRQDGRRYDDLDAKIPF
ncbi:hypothetical protein NKI09_15500 [Mesorhizobium sp. M0757]|uniref:hypothetical protein n=1 Tax=Mesorhizobium sp. M0757 TaxID=2956993 RepID=UPI003336F25F